MHEGYRMAQDALGLVLAEYEDQKKTIPSPSLPNQINLEHNQYIVVIEFDRLAYSRRHNNASIKKTLTIPSWLNELATEQHINFSQVLQEALINKLHLQ